MVEVAQEKFVSRCVGPTPATTWTGKEIELRRDQMNRAIVEVKEIEP